MYNRYDNINKFITDIDKLKMDKYGTVYISEEDDYDISLEEANQKVKELFGEKCNKQMPKEGNDSFWYNEETEKYEATGVELDNKQDTFLINNIAKTKEGYQVEIIEYLINHMNESNITVENTNEESIEIIENNTKDKKIKEIEK